MKFVEKNFDLNKVKSEPNYSLLDINEKNGSVKILNIMLMIKQGLFP